MRNGSLLYRSAVIKAGTIVYFSLLLLLLFLPLLVRIAVHHVYR